MQTTAKHPHIYHIELSIGVMGFHPYVCKVITRDTFRIAALFVAKYHGISNQQAGDLLSQVIKMADQFGAYFVHIDNLYSVKLYKTSEIVCDKEAYSINMEERTKKDGEKYSEWIFYPWQ